MLSEAGVVPGPLRWSVGDRVECWWRQSKADEGCWVAGTVVSHWWRHAEWPEAQVAPYQVQLDDGKLIFALRDDDDCIREATPLLGLDPERPERRELTAAEAAVVHETTLSSRLCESHFGTITPDGSGKKPGPSLLIPRLHQFDVVDSIKFMASSCRTASGSGRTRRRGARTGTTARAGGTPPSGLRGGRTW